MFALAARLIDLDGSAPDWVQLLPLGDIQALDGRKWRIPDIAAAEAVVRVSLADRGQTELFIDYDHAIVSVLQRAPNATARAAAWIKEMDVRSDGIYARVEWTPAAQAAIAAREYRYLSPFFTHDQGGTVRQIINAALVNRPALDMPALAAAFFPKDGVYMDQELLKALGLTPDARPEAATAAASALMATVSALRSTLGLNPDARPDEIATRLAELVTPSGTDPARTPDPNQFVPRALFDTVAAEVRTLKEASAAAAASDAVTAAVAAGRLPPAQKGWALGYATADLKGFETFIAGQPVLTERSAASALPPAPGGIAGLTGDEAAVCAALGLAPAEYLKHKEITT